MFYESEWFCDWNTSKTFHLASFISTLSLDLFGRVSHMINTHDQLGFLEIFMLILCSINRRYDIIKFIYCLINIILFFIIWDIEHILINLFLWLLYFTCEKKKIRRIFFIYLNIILFFKFKEREHTYKHINIKLLQSNIRGNII